MARAIEVSDDVRRLLDLTIDAVEVSLDDLKEARKRKRFYKAYCIAKELRDVPYAFCATISEESMAAAKDWGSAVWMPDSKEWAIVRDL